MNVHWLASLRGSERFPVSGSVWPLTWLHDQQTRDLLLRQPSAWTRFDAFRTLKSAPRDVGPGNRVQANCVAISCVSKKFRCPSAKPARSTLRVSSAKVKSLRSSYSASVMGVSLLHARSNAILNTAPRRYVTAFCHCVSRSQTSGIMPRCKHSGIPSQIRSGP